VSSERLGDFIRRLFTDVDFKQAFLSDPNRVMDKFGLGKEAQAAILSVGVVAIAGVVDVTRALAVVDPTQIWFG